MSNFDKNRKGWVRFLCIALAGLMILGIGASAILVIIDLINESSHGHSHLFADGTFNAVLTNVKSIIKGVI